MAGKESPTTGVKPMSIAGRTANERERLFSMSESERAWRAQWLKDQHLSPNEPRVVPEMRNALYNPIRRFYRFPLDTMQKMLEPSLGATRALKVRYFTGKFAMLYVFGVWAAYHAKYGMNDWTKRSSWYEMHSRVAVFEGSPGYPMASDRTKPSDYYDRKFKDNTLNL